MNQFTEAEIKAALFEIYSAGYVDGMESQKDIKTAFEDWYNNVKEKVKEN